MLTFDELVALWRAFIALSAVDLTILVTIALFASDFGELSLDLRSFSLTIVFCFFGEEDSDGVAIIFLNLTDHKPR